MTSLPAPLLLVLVAAGCADETWLPDAGAPSSARDRLAAAPRQLGLLADQAALSVDVSVRGADGWTRYPTELELRSGSVTLSAAPDGDLEMTAASLALDDIAVGDKGVPPTGLHLTDIEIHTRLSHECEWVSWAADGEACSASIPAVFFLEWSMVMTDGELVRLGTQELAPMDLWVDVGRDQDGITAQLRAVEPGPLWSWAGLVEIADLELEVPAHELIPFPADQDQGTRRP